MSYNYEKQRPFVFTDEGQRVLLAIRDRSQTLMKLAGCMRTDKLIAHQNGDIWDILACIDRLIEIGDLFVVAEQNAGQFRILSSKKW